MKVTAIKLIIAFVSANLLSLQTLPNPLSTAATNVLVKAGVKKIIRIPLLSDGITYLIDPDTTTIQGSMQEWMEMAGVLSLGTCDSVRCSQFVSNCAVKLGLPRQTDSHVVFLSRESARCVDDFFNLPLETQSEQRDDSNLNRLLSAFSPNIRNLTCLNNHTELKVSGANKTEALYQINFNSTGQIEKVI